MSDVAAYHVLFPVQGGMWTGYSQSTYLPALETIHDMLSYCCMPGCSTLYIAMPLACMQRTLHRTFGTGFISCS